jgi:aminomethyltransferase
VPKRQTPYFHKFVELGAELVERIGFEAAFKFTTIEDEHIATREHGGLYDVYYQGPVDVKGTDAQRLLQQLTVRDIERRLAADGTVLYTSLCNGSGGMVDDLTCFRLSSDHYWVVPTPSRADLVAAWLADHAQGMHAYITSCVSGTAYLSVQGPASREALATITEADLSTAELPYFRFVHTVVAGVPTLLSRTGYSGELGYELFYPRDYAEHVWDAVYAAGRDHEMKPCGLGALRSVRMEKKYPLYGLDVDETTSPIEAGLGWAVDADKANFLGRERIAREIGSGVSRQLVGIAFPDMSFIPDPKDSVVLDGRSVGHVTSADRGHWLGKGLALAYVEPQVPESATVAVRSGASGATVMGTVTRKAFYDPDGSKVRP